MLGSYFDFFFFLRIGFENIENCALGFKFSVICIHFVLKKNENETYFSKFPFLLFWRTKNSLKKGNQINLFSSIILW